MSPDELTLSCSPDPPLSGVEGCKEVRMVTTIKPTRNCFGSFLIFLSEGGRHRELPLLKRPVQLFNKSHPLPSPSHFPPPSDSLPTPSTSLAK